MKRDCKAHFLISTMTVVMLSTLMMPPQASAQQAENSNQLNQNKISNSSTVQQSATNSVLANKILIPSGTEVLVANVNKISSRKVIEGQLIQFKVISDVVINGKTVIKAGSFASGTVTEAKRSKMLGRGGTLEIEVNSTKAVDGQTINLQASTAAEGRNNLGSRIATSILFNPVAFLGNGKNAVIKKNTPFRATVDGEYAVNAP